MSNINKINQRQGKRSEKEIAKRVSGCPVGDRGGQDVWHPIFSIECKSYKTFGFIKFFKQAVSNARKKMPCLICHQKGTKYDDSYIIIQMKDAIELGMFKTKHDMPKIFGGDHD